MRDLTRNMKSGRIIFRSFVLSLAIVALGSGQVWGQQDPVTRQGLVAAVERAPGPTKGRRDAPITVVEFADFQCSFCWKFWEETLPAIETEYIGRGKARFIFRNLVALGPGSERAAEAAACAWEQGQFWAYHDRLFEKRGRLAFTDPRLVKELRLDPVALDACIASGRHSEAVGPPIDDTVETARQFRRGARRHPFDLSWQAREGSGAAGVSCLACGMLF
jgi:protein-disulfide isomerase